MLNSIFLRVLTFAILWIGLGVLGVDNMADSQYFWQAAAFSILVVLGIFLEKYLGYNGENNILPVVQTMIVIGLVFLVRINPAMAENQFIWVNIGLMVYYAVLFGLKDYRKLGQYQYLWGLTALLLLLLTLVFGVNIHGATRWIFLGGHGFQPEELVKVSLLLFMASYLDSNKELLRTGTVQIGRLSLPDRRTLGPFVFIGIFVLGMLAAQKSLGTALVFFLLMVLIIYMVTERVLYLLMSLPVIIISGTLGYFLFGHVRVRVAAWLNPWIDADGGGYQIAQSLFAISGGRFLGTGLGNGIGAYQIPYPETDFIFSVIAEEIGFVGAMGVISLFIILVMRAFSISIKALDRFGQILAAGIGILIGVEALIILAGVTKMLPLTGIPLPWISYGGSSMLIHCLLLGVLANISHNSSFSVSDFQVGKRAGVL